MYRALLQAMQQLFSFVVLADDCCNVLCCCQLPLCRNKIKAQNDGFCFGCALLLQENGN
jgi:hypothetical protein